jgi:hypothetical protein
MPDAQIRGGPADLFPDGFPNPWVGGDVYSPVPQTYQRQVKPGKADQFNIKIENDSDCPDIFTVKGQGSSSRYMITYYSIDSITLLPVANITTPVVVGTYQTGTLNSGESALIRAYIYVRPGVRSGSWMTDLIGIGSSDVTDPVTNFSEAEVRDFVTARVVVNRSAGDWHGTLPVTLPVLPEL